MDQKILIIKTLIVDDYMPLREAAVMVLKANGFEEVLEAESPERGMEMFREHKPELVILDIIMPSIRGIDLVGEIKELNPRTKVVMLTVLSGDIPREESFAAGADLYLVKPLNQEKVDEIKGILG
jgi:DNA-binding NarL/FixJ family response regulator